MDLVAALNLQKTAVAGHYVFPAPPSDFNPARASDEELARCGLPHRPNPKAFPHATRQWISVMKRLKRFVTPELKLLNARNGPTTSPTQAGLLADKAAPYSQIWGMWDCPAIVAPPNLTLPQADLRFSIWAGIQSNTTSNLVQAGTYADLNQTGFPDFILPCTAWYEWYPANAVNLTNFTLSPGDTFCVSLQSSQKTTFPGTNLPLPAPEAACQIAFANLTTGDYTSLLILPPSQSLPFPTDQAEWILERCSSFQDGGETTLGLPQFGVAALTFGGAVGANGQEVIVGFNDQGTLVTMTSLQPTGVTDVTPDLAPGLLWNYESNM